MNMNVNKGAIVETDASSFTTRIVEEQGDMLEMKPAVDQIIDGKLHIGVKNEPLENETSTTEPRENSWPIEVVIKEEPISLHSPSKTNGIQEEQLQKMEEESVNEHSQSKNEPNSPVDVQVKLELIQPMKQEAEDCEHDSILGVPHWSVTEQRWETGNVNGVINNIPQNTIVITESTKIIHCAICRKVHVAGMCPKALELSTTKKSKKSGRKPHKCDVCGRAFQDARALKIHKFIHTGEKPYKCDICDKPFSQQGSLQRHKSTHSGDKPYVCDICGKSFSRQDYLQPHKLIHVTDKPFKCDTCGKSFAYKCALKNHKMSHLGEKPHKCDICGQCFSHRGSLPAHKLIHIGNKQHGCEICGKSFLQRAHLRRHKLIHEKEKPHKCGICNKSFVVKSALQRHTTVHFRESKHKCDVCSMFFSKKVTLRVHRAVHAN